MNRQVRGAVVFDLGGVLIDWDPRYLYRQLLATDDEIADFLTEVGFDAWNHRLDAGEATWSDAVAALSGAYPHRQSLIEAYPARFAETMRGPIEETVEVLHEMDRAGVPLYALTNWSAETFDHALARFDFLGMFDGIVVSGQERVAKPDPAIFRVLLERYRLHPSGTTFVDDKAANVAAAELTGMVGLLFTGPTVLRRDLRRLGFLVDGGSG